jgi:hypothetical protein
MSMLIEAGLSQPQRAPMIGRKIVFQPLTATTPAKPTRVGQATYHDNSALTIWDESGNEIFVDVDFMLDSGSNRHCLSTNELFSLVKPRQKSPIYQSDIEILSST